MSVASSSTIAPIATINSAIARPTAKSASTSFSLQFMIFCSIGNHRSLWCPSQSPGSNSATDLHSHTIPDAAAYTDTTAPDLWSDLQQHRTAVVDDAVNLAEWRLKGKAQGGMFSLRPRLIGPNLWNWPIILSGHTAFPRKEIRRGDYVLRGTFWQIKIRLTHQSPRFSLRGP